MLDSQETPSSRSAFRDDREDEDLVEQMYDAADQMSEGMPLGLDGSFEYRGGWRRVDRERVEHTDQSGEDDEPGDGVTMAAAEPGGE